MASALRRLTTPTNLAFAGGIALSAYVLQSHAPVAKAKEPEIFVINGCAAPSGYPPALLGLVPPARRSPARVSSSGAALARATRVEPARGAWTLQGGAPSHDPVCARSFYMARREKYTTPGTSIYYYLVEWDPATP